MRAFWTVTVALAGMGIPAAGAREAFPLDGTSRAPVFDPSEWRVHIERNA